MVSTPLWILFSTSVVYVLLVSAPGPLATDGKRSGVPPLAAPALFFSPDHCVLNADLPFFSLLANFYTFLQVLTARCRFARSLINLLPNL